MEFWGVEVKAGESVKVEATQDVVIHISQAALGDAKNDKKNELVPVFLTVDSKKLIIGSLSAGKISQIACDFVLDRDFELSHNWKKGSVYFCGYRSPADCDSHSESESESDSDFGSDIPIIRTENGKSEPKNANVPAKNTKITTAQPTMSDSDDSEISDSDDSDSSNSEGGAVNVSGISLSGDESEDDSSDDDSSDEDISEETPKKVEPTKKRKAEEASTTPVPEKKAKLVTPQKSGEKKKGGVHVATPYPSKKSKQSGGQAASKSKN